MSKSLPFDDHHAWFAAFDAATTTRARFGVIARLPLRLSGGWRATLRNARTLAHDAGQTSVIKRLDARAKRLDAVCAHDASQSYACSSCGEVLPFARFGYRQRWVKTAKPHHDVVETDADRGFKVRFRQNSCSTCRGSY